MGHRNCVNMRRTLHTENALKYRRASRSDIQKMPSSRASPVWPHAARAAGVQSRELSLHAPFHSLRPHGLRIFTSIRSPVAPRRCSASTE